MRFTDHVLATAITVLVSTVISALLISLMLGGAMIIVFVLIVCFMVTLIPGVPLSLLIHAAIKREDSWGSLLRIAAHAAAGYLIVVVLAAGKASQSDAFAMFAYSGIFNGLIYGICYEGFRRKWSKHSAAEK
ncbi:hypothetical protein [Paenibacillus sp. NEAU-GSW1]|uniref:hypothetical protein n=1 Tax=Paenibacillus sp. NEAU-GSW1 TaxID=2682486 RepID=UPI0012E26AE3|nr:hypothetical protein [Paenibacillus sp. NEAU-GSW1]MUT68723.1 hypothetical protein [Paenibacillus sp. NEAU-GSW1]